MPKLATLEDVLKSLQDIREKIESINLSRIAPRQISVNSLAQISNNLGLVTAGEFRTGNGSDPGKGFSGVRIAYPAMLYGLDSYNIVGINNDTLQVGISASDGKLYAGAGAVVLDAAGVFISNLGYSSNLSTLNFGDSNNTHSTNIAIGVDTSNRFIFGNRAANPKMRFAIVPVTSPIKYAALDFFESSDVSGHYILHYYAYDAAADPSISIGPLDTLYIPFGIELFGGRFDSSISNVTGSTYIRLGMGATTPPPQPHLEDNIHIYTNNGRFILQFNDAGTTRYKYLDMNGTGVTWVHTTTPP